MNHPGTKKNIDGKIIYHKDKFNISLTNGVQTGAKDSMKDNIRCKSRTSVIGIAEAGLLLLPIIPHFNCLTEHPSIWVGIE